MKTPTDLGPIISASVMRFVEGTPAAMRALEAASLAGEPPSALPEQGAAPRKRARREKREPSSAKSKVDVEGVPEGTPVVSFL
jgi:hypothetical protein